MKKALLLILLLPQAALADNNLGNAKDLGIPALSFEQGINGIVQTLSIIAAILSVIFLVLGGINYAASDGSPQRVDGAKRTITYAIAGLVISLLATFIVSFVTGRAPH